MNRRLVFQNISRDQMDFHEVFNCIYSFMKEEPIGKYKLMIGTDSQVHKNATVFITGIVVQRMSQGVWACFRKEVVPRKMDVLGERISFETALTEEVASLFTGDLKEKLISIVLPYIYKGASFDLEGHLDIGSEERNRTRIYVNEMMSRLRSLGLVPKIKPEAIVASGYANKYTK
ncbi:ribonuclease H-like YkuK family protein [Thalassobacillus pellis]|uniref:ribonuclease H-like YkuK family protein n=1 Tax=Thalassobacillus pellis TaxID=748008 RepID=UPI001962140A|nr:ribonuclease H-like YkuK family protein [Thalassobacillus pellis]MBM7551262.1 putative RNase H-related nuclease YkuK (DUF458 family) [Thalassobacillus pellis]